MIARDVGYRSNMIFEPYQKNHSPPRDRVNPSIHRPAENNGELSPPLAITHIGVSRNDLVLADDAIGSCKGRSGDLIHRPSFPACRPDACRGFQIHG